MNKPNFSAMSKEEIIAYYEKQLAEQSKSQTKIILNLKSELTKSKDSLSDKVQELDIAKKDNKKLTTHNNNLKDLVNNILSHVKEHQSTYSKYFKEENIPMVDAVNITELNMYFDSLMITLFNAVDAVIKHQERSLNLGTSEKNKGKTPITDYSSDEDAKAEGEDTLLNTFETQSIDTDEKDFDEQSEEFIQEADIKDEGLTENELEKVILSKCSNNKKEDITKELSFASNIIEKAQNEIKSKDESQNKSNSDNKELGFVSVCNSNKVAGILENGSETIFRAYCSECGRVETFKLNLKKKRINSILTITDSLSSLGSVLSSVQIATCKSCGSNLEINPASLINVTYKEASNRDVDAIESTYNPQENGIETDKSAKQSQFSKQSNTELNTKETESNSQRNISKTALEQQLRKEQYKSIAKSGIKSQELLSEHLMKVENSSLPVINPATFDATVFGMTPAFVKSRLSTSLLCACGTQFTQLGAPKNRTFNYFEGNGFPMSREHLTGAINSFARAFLHPVTKLIKKDIVTRCPAVIMDESTLLVRESAQRKAIEGKSRKSQIWTLNSNWTSEFKASWFTVSDSRSYQNVLDILGDDIDSDKSPLKYLISDGYAGYDAALKILHDQGISIQSCRCWAHGRRPLHYLLKEMGLLKIYNEYLLPAGARFFDFEQNLKKYRESKQGQKLSDRSAQLLSIYWMINALFVIDSAVVRKHKFICNTQEFKQELLKARKELSSKIVDAIFDSIRMFIALNPKLINCSVSSKGEIRYIQNRKYPESKALIYLLKFEKNLRAFTDSPDIELTSSAAERSLKLGICTRHACMFMHSEDGANAFADFQTIVNTCILNRVPVQHYLVWLVANIKWRMNQLRDEGRDDPTFFTMPGKKKLLTENGTKLLAMYSKENRLGYDKVNVEGLTPYNYRQYLEANIGQK